MFLSARENHYSITVITNYCICIVTILLLKLIEKLADQKGNKNKPMTPTISRLETV